jgi:hypothetical protein
LILCMFFRIFSRRQILFCRRFGTLCQVHFKRLGVEYGPNRGFRNVGKTRSDAGEIPKRTYTIFKTRWKFEIKNNFDICVNCNVYHSAYLTVVFMMMMIRIRRPV